MADIESIIEQILAAARAKGGRAFSSERTYGDEPIIRRGSQLASYLPEPIRQMRALGRGPKARSWSDARLFVEQALLMEDYVDDFPYHGTFMSYFPTYDAMSDQQLRGYFTWRAHVREGRVEKTSASFAYVYLYELLNGIGTEPGEPAFRAIESFWRDYREHEPSMDRYVRAWLVDYVVYHDLDECLAAPYLSEAHDRAVAVLAREEERALAEVPARGRKRTPHAFGADPAREEALFSALAELSTYRLDHARLYKDHPEDLTRVTCAVFDQLARYCKANRTQGLVEGLFGLPRAIPHLMFASAVFYERERHADVARTLGETRRYECRNGIWTCTALHDGGQRSSKLGQTLRAVDRQLRAALDYPHLLKEQGDPKYLVRLIDREIADYLEWTRTHAPVRVEIDLSKLAGIRAGAAATRESLLIDEEREDEAATPTTPTTPAAPPAPERQEPRAEKNPPLDLTTDELELIQALLDGRAPGTAAADLLVDSVNEKLFDLLGDTAVEFDETGTPALVEDYVDDVRKALG